MVPDLDDGLDHAWQVLVFIDVELTARVYASGWSTPGVLPALLIGKSGVELGFSTA